MQNPSLSFAELEKKKIVSPEELKTTLKDYVDTGSAIIGSVVIIGPYTNDASGFVRLFQN